jgi:hypothetical protein
MSPDDALPVRHDPVAERFEIEFEGELAFVAYRREEATVLFTHTEVPSRAQGRGLAALLVRVALDWARSEGLRVRPLCSYVAAYMRRHPETQDLLAPATR